MGKDLPFLMAEQSQLYARMHDVSIELAHINNMLIKLSIRDPAVSQTLDELSTRLGECVFRLRRR